MKLKHSVLAVLFLLSSYAYSWDFQVITKNGDVKYKSGKSWKDVKIGQKLTTDDNLKLGDKSYINLKHQSGGTIDISESGTYSCSDLAKKASKTKNSVSKKLSDKVIKDISSNQSVLAQTNFKSQSSVTGAGERAIATSNTSSDIAALTGLNNNTSNTIGDLASVFLSEKQKSIVLRLPRSSYIVDSIIEFSWYSKEGMKDYYFVIADANGKFIYSNSIKDTIITLNLNQIGLAENALYYWFVGKDENKSEIYTLFRKTAKETAAIDKEINNMITELGNTQSAMNSLILAAFYADKNIQTRAANYFKEAILLAPGVTDYVYLYARYLMRIGLYNEGLQLLSQNN
jgi:hypothetical protein